MIYMSFFWGLLVLAWLCYFILKNSDQEKAEKYSFLVLLLAVSFLVIAIATRDPIFAQWGVPVEFEWVVGVALALLGSWKIYLNPLKERLLVTEKDIVFLKTTVTYIKSEVEVMKSDLSLIKDALLGKKRKK